MSELEDKISSILGNPAEMDKIAKMAAQFMGGGPPDNAEAPKGEAGKAPPGGLGDLGGLGGFDPELISKLGRLVSRAEGTKSDKTALLKAMSPYLAKRRRDKMEKAIRLAQIARIAGVAMEEYGGGKNV